MDILFCIPLIICLIIVYKIIGRVIEAQRQMHEFRNPIDPLKREPLQRGRKLGRRIKYMTKQERKQMENMSKDDIYIAIDIMLEKIYEGKKGIL